MSKSNGIVFRVTKGLGPIILISLLALGVSLFAGRFTINWEPAIHDQFMRWRHYLLPASSDLVHPDISAVGIDSSTQKRFGRFGSGMWLTRQPFLDQLSFMNDYLKPTVLAYDIIFEDPLGRVSRKNRITGSEKRLALVTEQVSTVMANPGVLIHPVVLAYMNRLASEQGTSWLAHKMAGMNTEVVLGYYFRGGWMDPQPAGIGSWTEEDLKGDEDGSGMRIPYLTDVRIPDSDIIFPGTEDSDAYGWAPNANLPIPELLDYSLLGFVNCPRDADGIVRRVPLVAGFKYTEAATGKERSVIVPSLALLPYLLHAGIKMPLEKGVIKVHFGKEIIVNPPRGESLHIPVDGQGRLRLNFDAAFDDFKAVNFVDTSVPEGARAEFKAERAVAIKDRIEGKIVIVGVTSGQDSGPTPLSSETPFMHIHLTAINNILNRSFIGETSGSERLLLFFGVWVLVTIICCVERTARLGPTAILLTAGYSAGAFVMIYAGIRIVPVLIPVFYVALCTFSVMSYRFFTEEKAKKKIRGMFSTMVSDRVLAYLEQNPESFSLKGHHADVSVFFSDVRGFTTISEQFPPERLTALLNLYFNMVTDCIMGSGGYLDKYVGDGVMAVWGAPFPDHAHALKACRSALEQVKLLKELNQKLRAEFGTELDMRIGINSGPAIAGNMGSSRKFQYTVMGDTVNLASRLEPANKDFGTCVIIGPDTRESVKDIMATRLLARIIVKGKTEAVSIYELMGEYDALSEADRNIVGIYEDAMRRYLSRDWDGASELLQRIFEIRESDGPSRFLAEQVRLMKTSQPAEDWQGEYVRKEKG